MSKTHKALINFRNYSDSKLETVCGTILQSMTGNSNFLTPTPTLNTIQGMLDNYSAALINAATRDRNKVAVKNDYRIQLEQLMTQEANYVNCICNGDLPKLTSSGMPLSKLSQPRIIESPKTIFVEQGSNAGTVILKAATVEGASGYLHKVTPDPLTSNSQWQIVASSRSKYQFDNLEQGKKYWFMVAAVGSNDQVANSEVISQFVMQRNSEAA